MSIKYIFFDMDGTLLPMDAGVFARTYFEVLTAKMAPHGYAPQDLIDGINAGITATQTNDGTRTNMELFWEHFVRVTGERVLADRPLFDEFYAQDFQRIADSCGHDPEAKKTIALCRDLGYPVVVATEPIFPLCAMESRLRWAGVDPADVTFITSYETSHYCKPELGYYREITERLGVSPKECVMIGNDVGEDMPAEELGMRVFLLTDCLINKKNADVTRWAHGGYAELQNWLLALDSVDLELAPASDADVDPLLRWNTELIDRYEDPALIDREKVFAWCARKVRNRMDEYSCIFYRGEKAGYIRRCVDGDRIELDDLYILPAFQNQGIGASVLRRSIREADRPVYLYVFAKNTRAIALYERLGFRVTETVSPTRVIMQREPLGAGRVENP